MEFLILFITGLSVGLVSSFFGIGGGAIMIPVLYMLFPHLPPASIISISLGTILLSAAMNNWRFYKSGFFPKRKAIWIITATTGVGSFIGAQLIYLLPGDFIKQIFGFLLFIMAVQVFLQKKPSGPKEEDYQEKNIFLGMTCFFGGLLSSVTGLGGGAIFVPFFMSLVKLPINLVSPFSNVAMVAASFVGLLPHLFISGEFELQNSLAENSFIGHVNVLFILCLFAGAFFSSKLGVKLHSSVSPFAKKILLSSILMALSLKILIFP